MNISELNYLQVSLKTNWKEETVKLSKQIYFLSENVRQLVNDKFDKLHCQDQMKWSTQFISFDFSVFIVWKMIISDSLSKWKSYVVMNIQGLNQISQSDFYFLFLQTNITAVIQECHYILTVNCASFFYQWLVNLINQHKFTVVLHQSQKHFNVAVMKYCNSSSYVQQQMNEILYVFQAFAQEYVNNIVIFSRTLNEHVNHLHQVFQLFQNLNINLESKKFYLDYLTVILLEQQIDVLDLFIFEKKIKTLTELQFSTTLKTLKIYLDLTDWLHFYISYYTQITALLQTCKTALTKTLLVRKNAQKQHVHHIIVNISIKREIQIFNTLQNLFVIFIFLIHFNSEQHLYINVNAFKQYSFDAVVYYVDEDLKDSTEFSCHRIQFILFLNKLFMLTEQNYWSTEMKTASLVWIICKMRHLIELITKKKIIIFTNHSATIFIAQQTHLITTILMNKLNL